MIPNDKQFQISFDSHTFSRANFSITSLTGGPELTEELKQLKMQLAHERTKRRELEERYVVMVLEIRAY